LIGGVAAVILLGGPAPGSIGSCSETEEQFMSAPQHCANTRAATCARRLRCCLTTAPTPAEQMACTNTYNDCRAPIVPECRPSAWPSDCIPPTVQESEECVMAMLDVGRTDSACAMMMIDRPEPECVDLCERSAALVAPDDAGMPDAGSE
jgi:hypothetical protein